MKKRMHESVIFPLVWALIFCGYPHSLKATHVPDQDSENVAENIEEIVLTPERGLAYARQVIQQIQSDPRGVEGHVVEVVHFGEESDKQLLKIVALFHKAGIKVQGTVLEREEMDEAIADYTANLPDEEVVSRVLTRADPRSLPTRLMGRVANWFSPANIKQLSGELPGLALFPSVGLRSGGYVLGTRV